MKSKLFLILFLFSGAGFITGSILGMQLLVISTSFLVIPFLLLHYYQKTGKVSPFIVTVLICFYIRDILMSFGFSTFPELNYGVYFLGVSVLMMFGLSELKKAPVQLIEGLSLFIMYSFLCYLFFSLAEMVPTLVPNYNYLSYIHLLLLVGFAAVSYTAFILKSHFASLNLMLTGSCLLFSEASLFFKLFVIEDLSVIIFYPFFHVCTYFFFIRYALRRRVNSRFSFLT